MSENATWGQKMRSFFEQIVSDLLFFVRDGQNFKHRFIRVGVSNSALIANDLTHKFQQSVKTMNLCSVSKFF